MLRDELAERNELHVLQVSRGPVSVALALPTNPRLRVTTMTVENEVHLQSVVGGDACVVLEKMNDVRVMSKREHLSAEAELLDFFEVLVEYHPKYVTGPCLQSRHTPRSSASQTHSSQRGHCLFIECIREDSNLQEGGYQPPLPTIGRMRMDPQGFAPRFLALEASVFLLDHESAAPWVGFAPTIPSGEPV